jgi:hypothetical protein
MRLGRVALPRRQVQAQLAAALFDADGHRVTADLAVEEPHAEARRLDAKVTFQAAVRQTECEPAVGAGGRR